MSKADEESEACQNGGAAVPAESQDCSGQPRAVLTSEPYPALAADESATAVSIIAWEYVPWPNYRETLHAGFAVASGALVEQYPATAYITYTFEDNPAHVALGASGVLTKEYSSTTFITYSLKDAPVHAGFAAASGSLDFEYIPTNFLTYTLDDSPVHASFAVSAGALSKEYTP